MSISPMLEYGWKHGIFSRMSVHPYQSSLLITTSIHECKSTTHQYKENKRFIPKKGWYLRVVHLMGGDGLNPWLDFGNLSHCAIQFWASLLRGKCNNQIHFWSTLSKFMLVVLPMVSKYQWPSKPTYNTCRKPRKYMYTCLNLNNNKRLASPASQCMINHMILLFGVCAISKASTICTPHLHLALMIGNMLVQKESFQVASCPLL